MSLATVRVSADGSRVWLEGTELRGVRSVELHREVDGPIEVRLSLMCDRVETVDDATISVTMSMSDAMVQRLMDAFQDSGSDVVVMTCDHETHRGKQLPRRTAESVHPGCTIEAMAPAEVPELDGTRRLVDELAGMGEDLLREG